MNKHVIKHDAHVFKFKMQFFPIKLFFFSALTFLCLGLFIGHSWGFSSCYQFSALFP